MCFDTNPAGVTRSNWSRDNLSGNGHIPSITTSARDEKHAIGIEGGEPIAIGAATIENHDGSRLETQAARHAAFMHAAFGDERKTGEQSLMIKRQMQLHVSFRAPVLCPSRKSKRRVR